MITKLSVIFIFTVVTLIRTSKTQKCEHMAEYVLNAVNPDCQPSCQNRNGFSPCLLPTVSGCVCKSNFVKSLQQCINPFNCPPEGSPCATIQEEYFESGLPPACQKTCHQPYGISPCPHPNVPTCICKFNFVRNTATKVCVPVGVCPVKSSTASTSSTPPTTPPPPPPTTTTKTTPPPPTPPPPTTTTPPPRTPPPTSTTPKTTPPPTKTPPPPPPPPTTTTPPPGTPTTTANTVATRMALPCPLHEDFVTNGLHFLCQPTCARPLGLRNCPQGFYPVCMCKTPYIRNNVSTCILRENCPVIARTTLVCRGNETYDAKAPDPVCRSSCENPVAATICSRPPVQACVCRNLHFRNRITNACVLLADCPSRTEIYNFLVSREMSTRVQSTTRSTVEMQQLSNLCRDKPNTVYSFNAPDRECRPSCRFPTGLAICNKAPVSECVCRQPYVLYRITNQCILRSNCPNTVPYNIYNPNLPAYGF